MAKKEIDTVGFVKAVEAKRKQRQHGKRKSVGREVAEVAALVADQDSPKLPVLLKDGQNIEEINENSRQWLVVENYIIDAFRAGKLDNKITKDLVDAGYGYKSAQEVIRRVARSLSDEIERKKPQLVNNNIGILQNIIEQTIDSRDFKTALVAISELNRVLHAYDQKVEVKIENNFGFDFGMPSQTVTVENIEDIVPDESTD